MNAAPREMKYRSVRSSLVVAVGYDAAAGGTLGVIFRGGATYHYRQCPRGHYDNMLRASRLGESVGGYFHAHVRDKYEHARVDSAAAPVSAPAAMEWRSAGGVVPEVGKFYLVHTDGAEWGDSHTQLWPAPMLEHALRPQVVRGRPLWVAEVTDPTAHKALPAPAPPTTRPTPDAPLDEMLRALEADGEKLRQLTGNDRGPAPAVEGDAGSRSDQLLSGSVAPGRKS